MIEKVVDFLIKEGEGLFSEKQREELHDQIIRHIAYGTIKVWTDEEGIAAVARWNWRNNRQVEILDVAVRKNRRQRGIVKLLARKCLEENPSCIGMFYQDKQMKKTFYRKRQFFFKGDKHEIGAETKLRS